ncbi:MAG: EpsG family protein [Lachnospiraceae bacterium]|nr:EpsG family protein [Lachnospiraceae bacterium]
MGAAVFVLAFMMVFRYGQGPDYWQYRALYGDAPWKRGFPLFWYTRNLHSEVGFRLLVNCFTALGIPAFYFFAMWSLVSIGFVYAAIRMVSPYRSLSLLLLYPTCYLTYLFSGVRQGLVLAVFLCLGLRFYHQRKWGKYCLLVAVLMCFHLSSAVLFLLIPFAYIKRKWTALLPVAALGLGIVLCITPFHVWLSGQFNGIFSRLETVQISWMGLAERTLMYLLILGLYHVQKQDTIGEYADDLFRIYTFGYCIALGGMVNAYYSQRFSVPMKAVEILLFAVLIVNCSKKAYQYLAILFLTAVTWVMSCKNLGAYFEDQNAFEYQYIGIWDGPDEEMERYITDVMRWAENTYNENP